MAAPKSGFVLPLENTKRRPSSNALKTFSLSSLPFRTKTAMEPELAFIMVNLALAGNQMEREKLRILDPFCGCCSLLLAAAHQVNDRAELIGSDVSPFAVNASNIALNFLHHNLTPPQTLFCTDIAHLPEKLMRLHQEIKLDAIVCDVPYGMSEKKIGEFDCVEQLLMLASRFLKVNGRLVFFSPFTPIDSSLLPPTLSLTLSMEQIFSPTFSRFLTVICKGKE